MNLSEVFVHPIGRCDEQRYQHLMQEHHYLGRLPLMENKFAVLILL